MKMMEFQVPFLEHVAGIPWVEFVMEVPKRR
jgi:hypothetical protein